MTITEALAWLKQFDRFHIRPGLERMEAMLAALGRPQRGLRFIHIAGTNGKGSTGAFLSHLLRAHGYTVGTFSSPAVMHELDRIQYNGNRVSDTQFLDCVRRVKHILPDMRDRPTEFEVITVIALVYFARVRPDWIIWEAGLGGRWDSTNVVEPCAAVVTNVALDHEHVLGKTIPQIAREKAGILKERRPAVTGAEGVAAAVIERRANALHSPFFALRDHVRFTVHKGEAECRQTFSYRGLKHQWDALAITLPGRHQAVNACLSLLALEVLEKQGTLKLNEAAVKRGLSQTRVPGRTELFMVEERRMMIDSAHNPAASAQLAAVVRAMAYERLWLVLGIFADKDVDGVCGPLVPLADEVIVTEGEHPRFASCEALAKQLRRTFGDKAIQSMTGPGKSVRFALKQAGKDDLILAAGSHDLMSLVRKLVVVEMKAKAGDLE